MNHKISCRCGKLQGELDMSVSRRSVHLRCYCKDCQAFAHALDDPEGMLDADGGTEIIQVSPAAVRFTAGAENLACLRVEGGRLDRWYASCCRSPIGNTMGVKLPFIGLIHQSLSEVDRDDVFGPVDGVFYAESATSDTKPKGTNMFLGIGRTLKLVLLAKLSGAAKKHPFYSADGTPLSEPRLVGQ